MKIIISLMAVAMVLSFALAVIHGVELYRLKRILQDRKTDPQTEWSLKNLISPIIWWDSMKENGDERIHS